MAQLKRKTANVDDKNAPSYNGSVLIPFMIEIALMNKFHIPHVNMFDQYNSILAAIN